MRFGLPIIRWELVELLRLPSHPKTTDPPVAVGRKVANLLRSDPVLMHSTFQQAMVTDGFE